MVSYRWDQGQVKLEEEATFGAGVTGAESYYPHRGDRLDTSGLVRNYNPRDHMRAYSAEEQGIIAIKSDSTVQLNGYIHGYTSSDIPDPPLDVLPTAATAGHHDASLIGAALGARCYHTPAGVQTTADGNGAVIGWDVAAIANYPPGQMVCTDVSTGGTGTWEVGVVQSAAGNTLTFRAPNSLVPQNGAVVYGSEMAFVPLDDYQFSTAPSMAMAYQGSSTEDYYTMAGMRALSMKFQLDPKGFPMFESEWGMVDWTRDTGAALAFSAYSTFPDREAIIGRLLRLWDGTTRLTPSVASFEFDCGLNTMPILDPNGTGGLQGDPGQGWGIGMPDPTCTFNVLWENNDRFFDDYEDGTMWDVTFQVGSVPGRIWAITIPNAQIVEYPSLVEENGLVRQKLVMKPTVYVGDTGNRSNTTAADAPWACGWM